MGSLVALNTIITNNLNQNYSSFFFCILLFYLFFEVFFSFIRKINQNTSTSLNRKEYFIVQTPQCFIFKEIIEAYDQKYQDEFTDDASVFESIGGKIITINGEQENIKITYPIDLNLAEKLVN